MDGMSELEYWKKAAESLKKQNKRLEQSLANCHKINTDYQEMTSNSTHEMTAAQKNLFALKDRILEVQRIMIGRMNAAQIGLAGIKEDDTGYVRGLTEGLTRATLDAASLFEKAATTTEPLP